MLGQGDAGWVAVAGDDVDDTWGEAGFLDELCGENGLLKSQYCAKADIILPIEGGIFTVNGAFSLLFNTTVLPAAIAGAIL